MITQKVDVGGTVTLLDTRIFLIKHPPPETTTHFLTTVHFYYC